jgi:membrane-bound metal-dependent hydrolase YbcI (DUF457 family)
MDTITHGIAGALMSKAAFGGRDLFPPTAMGKRKIVTWALMLGAICPDADVLREFFSSNDMLMITWHRSVTHSLLLLSLWSLLLAAATLAVCRWRKWHSPSYLALAGLYAIGILSHILLDLATTFGTMIWSPAGWSRPAWDILFIIDFTFTAILLVPQLLAWVYEDQKRSRRRALIMWLIFIPAPYVISQIALIVGAPISNATIILAMCFFTAIFLLPVFLGWGHEVSYSAWNRAGLGLAMVYLAAATYGHHVAFERIQQFAARENIQVQSIGALPLPPSLWHWDGLVRAPRGVYEMRIDLSDHLFSKPGAPDPNVIQDTYYPDAFPNPFIEKARQLPTVQKVSWFARFPVTRFHTDGNDRIVEFLDLRFPALRPGRSSSFTYRVRFSKEGELLSQGWESR